MKKLLILLFLAGLLIACGDGDVYTLYRAGVGLPNLKVHVATFDSDDSKNEQFKTYNQDNCQIAMKLFQSQLNVTVRYWCEKGRLKK